VEQRARTLHSCPVLRAEAVPVWVNWIASAAVGPEVDCLAKYLVRISTSSQEEKALGQVEDALHSQAEPTDRAGIRGLARLGEPADGSSVASPKWTIIDADESGCVEQAVLGTLKSVPDDYQVKSRGSSVIGILSDLSEDRFQRVLVSKQLPDLSANTGYGEGKVRHRTTCPICADLEFGIGQPAMHSPLGGSRSLGKPLMIFCISGGNEQHLHQPAWQRRELSPVKWPMTSLFHLHVGDSRQIVAT